MSRQSFFAERRADGQWRILRSWNGDVADICGAVDASVAWATARILTDMRMVMS